jgi:hypothetical protein
MQSKSASVGCSSLCLRPDCNLKKSSKSLSVREMKVLRLRQRRLRMGTYRTLVFPFTKGQSSGKFKFAAIAKACSVDSTNLLAHAHAYEWIHDT